MNSSLVNPYKIPPDNVMQTIELMGKHVLTEFAEQQEAPDAHRPL